MYIYNIYYKREGRGKIVVSSLRGKKGMRALPWTLLFPTGWPHGPAQGPQVSGHFGESPWKALEASKGSPSRVWNFSMPVVVRWVPRHGESSEPLYIYVCMHVQ